MEKSLAKGAQSTRFGWKRAWLMYATVLIMFRHISVNTKNNPALDTALNLKHCLV
jgi:hypothetical protein